MFVRGVGALRNPSPERRAAPVNRHHGAEFDLVEHLVKNRGTEFGVALRG